MNVHCSTCGAVFDDTYRLTFCPHDTFAANDGHNRFAHHPESTLWAPPAPDDDRFESPAMFAAACRLVHHAEHVLPPGVLTLTPWEASIVIKFSDWSGFDLTPDQIVDRMIAFDFRADP